MSLPDPDHVPSIPGRLQAAPVRTAAVVIYATLIALVLTIPQSLVNWARNFEPSRSQEAILIVADALQASSDRLGISRAFIAARQLFLDTTGKRED